MTKIFNPRNTVIFVALIVLWKAFLSYVLELHPDEAYYWLWSRRLAMSYYDHSPMVAYFIRLTTFFSHNELAVRFSTIIVTVILSYVIFKFTKKIFSATVISSADVNSTTLASAAVVLLNTLPIMLVGSIVITPDTPLLLFYGLALVSLYNFISYEKTKDIYFTGLFLGLAMLSKYTALFFLPCLLLYMISVKKFHWFKNPHFYGAGLLALAIFSPVLIWNTQHGWISFNHQVTNRLTDATFRFGRVGDYLGGQMLAFGPVVFVPAFLGGIYTFFCALKKANAKMMFNAKILFLLSFALPPIVFFIFVALKRNPGANWPAFAYIPLSIFTVYYLLNGGEFKKKLLTWGIALNVVLCIIVGLNTKYSFIPLARISHTQAIADATNWFGGWRMLADKLLYKDVKLAIANSHQRAAIISYYTRDKIFTVVEGPRLNHFAFWPVPEHLKTERTAIVDIDHRMNRDFSELEYMGATVFRHYRYGIPIRQYAIRIVMPEQAEQEVYNGEETEETYEVATQ